MKERGKSVESQHENTNFFSSSNYFSSSSDLPYCGEQRLSSCSCSDVSSYRNSSCTMGVGSVGRLSFFIENEKGCNGDEKKTLLSHMNQISMIETETDDVVFLKRSSSCVVEVKKSNSFWRIGKIFKKKREKERCSERNNRGGFDHVREVCVMDVSRSRSLSSFMDGNFGHEVGSMACSTAKVSDFNQSESRMSGFRGGSIDFESGFSVKDSDFIRMDDDDDDDDDSEFIDLKIDLSDKSTKDKFVFKKYDPPELTCGDGMGSSSCRVTLNEREIEKVKNNHTKAWKGIFKHHSGKKDLITS
ncbi:unnamed protein product [Lactuca virosa]|uniref:Uncharacterized protein n=1 Tax=Lactuca virosa TaxID=75947 RepID=A0AAU9NC37_9ASTR|nr:unnamed protein product [Lactuca virosa]